ncbi:glycosyltransferase family 2 protein [Rhizophagus clarus]|uniref:Glycosyltransferase family 2 protein n=1 Tax=Rhizophagus clarus TaxID=94130 RepID=A0A8H3LWW3_9GLOM|nr:glycosyltransferase family 2 protein [Rhizophagus clarus]
MLSVPFKIISNNPSSILNPLSPVKHSIKPRGVTITINHKQPIFGNGSGSVKGKDNNADNAKNNDNPKAPKNQKHPKNNNDQKRPKNNDNQKQPKNPKRPKVPKVPKVPKTSNNPKNKTKDNPNNSNNNNSKTKTPNQPAPNQPAPAQPAPVPSNSTPPTPPVPTPQIPAVPTNISSTPSLIPQMDNYIIKYYEDNPDLNIYSAISYPDGPIILRLTGNTSDNNSCYDPTLYLRLVYNNVTVNYINFTFEIPDYNFCIYGGKDLIRIFSLNKDLNKGLNGGFFLVSYLQKTDGEFYQEKGLIVDWDGQVHSQLILSLVGITPTDISQLGKVVLNADPQNGFIWVNRIQNTLQWTNFSSPDEDGNVNSQGEMQKTNIPDGYKFEIFATLDGGYGYVTVGLNPNATETLPKTPPELLVIPLWIVNVIFIRPYTGEVTQPSLIYQRVSPANDMNIELCDNAYDSPGLMCIFSVQVNADINYVKIGFLSNGSTKEPIKLDIDTNTYSVDRVYSLYNGGHVVGVKFKNTLEVISTGIIYNSQGGFLREWDCPRIVGNLNVPKGVFPNNTFWMFSNGGYSETNETNSNSLIEQNNSGWSMMTTNIPKLTMQFDYYNNLNVNTTLPEINGTINLGATLLRISYNRPVVTSIGNISIYQYDTETGQLILKQSYCADTPFTLLSQDKQTLTLSALNSTFNNPGQNYTVVIDNNAVEDLSSEEPLMGISPNIWTFSTEFVPQHHNSQEHALVRLMGDASFYFRDLSNAQKSNFVQLLLSELAQSVPVPPNRLYTNTRFQWDPDVDSKQILLKFKILPGKNEQELSADNIINSLDNMIKYKDVSPISHSLHTAMLDSNYGFVYKRSVWDKYGFSLFAIGATLLLLGVLAMLSYKKDDDGNSFVSFKVLLIALDFVLDFAFVVNHSRDVYILYYPSLLTFIIPLGFNTIITFFILIRELSNNKEFYAWFRTYHNVAAIFTFCSVVDVESLTMINSKLADLAAFDAPISLTTENWILTTCIWNFIIEDTPQLIIQIIYIFLSVNYEIIPFLNLITASLLWICILCGRSYHLFLYCQDRYIDRRLQNFTVEYTNINNGNNNNRNGNENEVFVDNGVTEIRSVEYVLAPPLEEVSPATIRPPSWWLNTTGTEYQKHNSRSVTPNSGVIDDESNGGERQNDTGSDYQLLERRSSLYNGVYIDDNDIGIAGPSTIYNRNDNEHDANTSGSMSYSGYERIFDNGRTSRDFGND